MERQIELQHEIMREEIERQVSDQNLANTELKIIEKELQLAELRLDATNSFELDTDVSKLRTSGKAYIFDSTVSATTTKG